MTDTFFNFGIVAATVVGMEIFAAVAHRHIMHGWGWGWHRSHHEPRNGVFELNDLYAVVFALPSILLIYLGVAWEHWMAWIGVGMTVYGFLYWFVHDGLVHNRWPFRVVPRTAYVKRLVQAHRMHHAVHGREGCVSFGFLYAKPVRKLKEELQRLERLHPVGPNAAVDGAQTGRRPTP